MKAEKFGWKALAINLFPLVWLIGMAAGITAGGCRKKTEPSKKLTFCNLTITLGSIFPGESAKRSILNFERGVALSQLGREDEALKNFRRAILDANGGIKPNRATSDSGEQRLLEMIARVTETNDANTRAAWDTVFSSFPGAAKRLDP